MDEIQIQFPRLGNWQEINMTAIYRDNGGYTHQDHYTQDTIPADQAPAMQAVVSALVGLAEPWQASQVWARLGTVTVCDEASVPVAQIDEIVELTVEAVNAQGGRRIFTAEDYPEFVITDPAAVAFFKHFTNQ